MTVSDLELALDPPRAHGGALGQATFKREPADFCVEERLGFAADGGQGQELLLVEKIGLDTHTVARALARHAGCAPRDVGFAGLKDRQARTRQWFTVPVRPRGITDWRLAGGEAAGGAGFRVLEAAPHARKLKRGALKGNRFEITLREVQVEPASLAERLALLGVRGAPNYVGPQRFGREASNLDRVAEYAATGHAPRDPVLRGFVYSAARSLLFNAVLARRVRLNCWDALLAGEFVNLDGSRSYFAAAEIDATLTERLRRADVHPTGPLWGEGAAPTLDAGALEAAALAPYADLTARLSASGLKSARRATRVVPRDIESHWQGDQLTMAFSLGAGAFATTVLAELVTLSAGLPGEPEVEDG